MNLEKDLKPCHFKMIISGLQAFYRFYTWTNVLRQPRKDNAFRKWDLIYLGKANDTDAYFFSINIYSFPIDKRLADS